MKGLRTYVVLGFCLGVVTATAGFTSVPRPVFIGTIIAVASLYVVAPRARDTMLKFSVGIGAWVIGSFVTLNWLLPPSMR